MPVAKQNPGIENNGNKKKGKWLKNKRRAL
jgi:hypothetical protein